MLEGMKQHLLSSGVEPFVVSVCKFGWRLACNAEVFNELALIIMNLLGIFHINEPIKPFPFQSNCNTIAERSIFK